MNIEIIKGSGAIKEFFGLLLLLGMTFEATKDIRDKYVL